MLEFLNANANYATWVGLVIAVIGICIAIFIGMKSDQIDKKNSILLKILVDYVGEEFIKQKGGTIKWLKNGKPSISYNIKVPAGNATFSGEPPSVSATSNTLEDKPKQ